MRISFVFLCVTIGLMALNGCKTTGQPTGSQLREDHETDQPKDSVIALLFCKTTEKVRVWKNVKSRAILRATLDSDNAMQSPYLGMIDAIKPQQNELKLGSYKRNFAVPARDGYSDEGSLTLKYELARRRNGVCDYTVEFYETDKPMRSALVKTVDCRTSNPDEDTPPPFEMVCERKPIGPAASQKTGVLLDHMREFSANGNGFADFKERGFITLDHTKPAPRNFADVSKIVKEDNRCFVPKEDDPRGNRDREFEFLENKAAIDAILRLKRDNTFSSLTEDGDPLFTDFESLLQAKKIKDALFLRDENGLITCSRFVISFTTTDGFHYLVDYDFSD